MNYVPQLISGSLHLGMVCSSVPIEPQEICISCGIEMNKSTPQFPYLSLSLSLWTDGWTTGEDTRRNDGREGQD